MSELKEQDVNHFIQLAIKKGFASASNVKVALENIKEKRQRGERATIVSEMIASGAITDFQADFLIKQISKSSDIAEIEVSQDSIIAGYEILSNLGVGGMGTVYKARQVSMDRIVALKVLKEELSNNDRYVMRFLKEAKTAGRINHQHVVNVYDVGKSSGLYYIAMEYVDGDNLKVILQNERQLSPDAAFTYGLQIARALRRMREHKIIHRDIKPENVFVTKSGQAKLGDLGIAKIEEDKGATQTRKGFVVGTFEYMSPEQASADKVDFRSDIFSLGVMIYTLIAGENPFISKTPADTVGNVLNKKPIALNKYCENFPQEASIVLSKMMAKNKEDRYSDLESLVRDLDMALWTIKTPAFKRNQEEEDLESNLQKYLITILFLLVTNVISIVYLLKVLANKGQ